MIQFNLLDSSSRDQKNKLLNYHNRNMLCGFPAPSGSFALDASQKPNRSVYLPTPQTMSDHLSSSGKHSKKIERGLSAQQSHQTNVPLPNQLGQPYHHYWWNECCVPLFFLASQHQDHQQQHNIKKHYAVVLWCTRFSCFFALLPLVLVFGRDDSAASVLSTHVQHNTSYVSQFQQEQLQWNFWALIMSSYANRNEIGGWGMRVASCLYLAIMPISSCFLQIFCYLHSSVDSMQQRIVTCLLCNLSLLSGNIAAILFIALPLQQNSLIIPKKTWNLAFFFLSTSFSIGSIQLLLLLRKTSILRIMFCTATAVSVITMCILAFQTSSLQNGKRFYQTTAIPFMLLFFETTRSHYTADYPRSLDVFNSLNGMHNDA